MRNWPSGDCSTAGRGMWSPGKADCILRPSTTPLASTAIPRCAGITAGTSTHSPTRPDTKRCPIPTSSPGYGGGGEPLMTSGGAGGAEGTPGCESKKGGSRGKVGAEGWMMGADEETSHPDSFPSSMLRIRSPTRDGGGMPDGAGTPVMGDSAWLESSTSAGSTDWSSIRARLRFCLLLSTPRMTMQTAMTGTQM